MQMFMCHSALRLIQMWFWIGCPGHLCHRWTGEVLCWPKRVRPMLPAHNSMRDSCWTCPATRQTKIRFQGFSSCGSGQAKGKGECPSTGKVTCFCLHEQLWWQGYDCGSSSFIFISSSFLSPALWSSQQNHYHARFLPVKIEHQRHLEF